MLQRRRISVAHGGDHSCAAPCTAARLGCTLQFSSLNRRRRPGTICMAHPRRVAKVASQIQREVSEMFIHDKVISQALCPERKTSFENSLSAIASVTSVYLSNDLQVAKVYVSIYSDEKGKQHAMRELKRLQGYVRYLIGQSMQLRLTPDVRFEYDASIDEQEAVQRVLEAEGVRPDWLEEEEEEEQRRLAATGSAAPAGGETEEDDAEGFFDGLADGTSQEPEDDWEDEEGEWVEESISDFLSRPGPFEDLFVGNDELVSTSQSRQGSRSLNMAGWGVGGRDTTTAGSGRARGNTAAGREGGRGNCTAGRGGGRGGNTARRGRGRSSNSAGRGRGLGRNKAASATSERKGGQ